MTLGAIIYTDASYGWRAEECLREADRSTSTARSAEFVQAAQVFALLEIAAALAGPEHVTEDREEHEAS